MNRSLQKKTAIILLTVICLLIVTSTAVVLSGHHIVLIDKFAKYIDTSFYITTKCWFTEPTTRTADCGYLYVRKHFSDNAGKTVRIPVVIFKAKQQSKGDPVLFLPGGPISVLASPEFTPVYWEGYLNHFSWLEKRDIIVFDYRGTGKSFPKLECEYTNKISLSDPKQSNLFARLSSCAQTIKQIGIDMSSYSTLSIALDVIQLRKALKVDEWNLVAVSYGTRVAMEILRFERTPIRSIVMSGLVPPLNMEPDVHDLKKGFALTIEKIIKRCDVQKACRERYGDLMNSLISALNNLDENPEKIWLTSYFGNLVNNPIVLDDSLFLSLLMNAMYTREGLSRIPSYIEDVNARRFGRFEPLIEEYLISSIDGSYNELLYHVVYCNDDRSLKSEYKEADPGLSYHLDSWLSERNLCDALHHSDENTRLPAFNTISNVPALIITGELDPVSQPEWGVEVARRFNNSYLYMFPNESHGALFSDCARKIIEKFLSEPKHTPDNQCLSNESELLFLTDR